MRKIKVMSEELSGRIAAGEVIERPASIVKELLENSLDAGATDIVIELDGGGKKSIRVSDNGEGIENSDVPLVFERHATSKIYEFEDIDDLNSFGFRGEAIASIASISKMEMLTRKKESLSGMRVLVEGGGIREVVDAGCPVGTSVTVKDIFYSTPVRMKFLKKESTEQAHCTDVITRLALSSPGVKIKVIANGRIVLDIPKTSDMSERISLVLGKNFSNNALTIVGEKENAGLSGFISMPDFTRSNTRGLFYYVNRRFVRDSLLNHALITSYRWLIEPKRYPSAVLFIELPPSDVDVNVHPTKMEVRFRSPREVYNLVVDIIAGKLSTLGYNGKPAESMSGIYRGRTEEALRRYTISRTAKKHLFDKKLFDEKKEVGISDLFEEREGIDREAVSFSSLNYLGQFAGTYLIFYDTDGIVMVDQHAAHERVLFEKLREKLSDEGQEKQKLLIPEVISISPGNFVLLMDNKGLLADVGLEIESYGENTVRIKSVPATLSNVNIETLISDIVEELLNTGKMMKISEVKEKIFTLFACKAAIKGNQRLSKSEVRGLCEDLDSVPFSSHCPHGRPLYRRFTKIDMEKMFKRR